MWELRSCVHNNHDVTVVVVECSGTGNELGAPSILSRENGWQDGGAKMQAVPLCDRIQILIYTHQLM